MRKKRWGKVTKQAKGERSMIKRLALLICCILLLPTIAASADMEGTTNYGDWWVSGQVGGVFSAKTEAALTSGVTVGYNFCMANRPSWQRYFGAALDFQWNTLEDLRTLGQSHQVDGNQFALALLARVQYPLMGDESFTRGKYVPFFMFGPAIVWTDPNWNFNADNRTDFGVVTELGLEYFVIPQLSVGPSYRFRWVSEGGGEFQHTILGRLAYHF
jgi:opacity protein-like surface antigen